MSEFKVLICGDGAIGKTCLLDTLTERNVVNWDNPDYVPTAAENLEVTWDIDGAGESRIEIWDTAGQETLETLRKTAYPGTQVLLIGFDTTNSVTLENVADTWITEFRGGCSDCPCIILVGTKYDWLKEDPEFHESPCSVDDDSILETAQKIGAHAVVLTSAKTGEGILCTDSNNAEPSFWAVSRIESSSTEHGLSWKSGSSFSQSYLVPTRMMHGQSEHPPRNSVIHVSATFSSVTELVVSNPIRRT